MEKEAIKAKRRARKLALQALYQWSISGHEVYEIEAQFHAMNKLEKADTHYFRQLLHDVVKRHKELEASFLPFLDRPVHSINPIELTVLRIGAYELTFCLEIPYRVVLDETVLLTKEFGSQDGFRYVNGILNNLARQLRKTEFENE